MQFTIPSTATMCQLLSCYPEDWIWTLEPPTRQADIGLAGGCSGGVETMQKRCRARWMTTSACMNGPQIVQTSHMPNCTCPNLFIRRHCTRQSPGALGLGRTARRGCERRRPSQQGGEGWVKAINIAAKAEEAQTQGRRKGPKRGSGLDCNRLETKGRIGQHCQLPMALPANRSGTHKTGQGAAGFSELHR